LKYKVNKKQIRKSKKILRQHFENIREGQAKFFPKSPKIPLAIPPYGWEEIDESLDSLLNMKTTMGEKVKLFEKKFAKYLKKKNLYHQIFYNYQIKLGCTRMINSYYFYH